MRKSILKKQLPPQTQNPSSSPQHLQAALFHADLIQQRKDIESQILLATENLLDFPSSSSSSHDSNPAHPAAQEDIRVAKNLLQCFQPSDLDALIEERNIEKKCGYIFCARPNRRQDTNARCRILQTRGEGRKSLRFVDRRVLERWCSDECGKRALFVRVQLNEEPAWTRAAGSAGDITFLEEEGGSTSTVDGALAEGLQKLNVGSEVDSMTTALDQLAIERGDDHARGKQSVLVEVNVHENTELRDPISIDHDRQSDQPGDSIEGYITRFAHGKTVNLA
jgi:hypothetical protein